VNSRNGYRRREWDTRAGTEAVAFWEAFATMPGTMLTWPGQVLVAVYWLPGSGLALVYSGSHGRRAAGWIQAQELAQVEDQGGEI
jgi:hypothetical protein